MSKCKTVVFRQVRFIKNNMPESSDIDDYIFEQNCSVFGLEKSEHG